MMATCRKREVTDVRHSVGYLPSLFTVEKTQLSSKERVSRADTTELISYSSVIMPPAFADYRVGLANEDEEDKHADCHQDPLAPHQQSNSIQSHLVEVSHNQVPSTTATLFTAAHHTSSPSPAHAIIGIDHLASHEMSSGLLRTDSSCSDLDVTTINDRDFTDNKSCVPDTLGAETVVETSSLDGNKLLSAALSSKRLAQVDNCSKGTIDSSYLMLDDDSKVGNKVIQAEDLVEILETQTLQAFLAQRDSGISSHSIAPERNIDPCVGGGHPMTKGMSIVYVGDGGMQLVPADTMEDNNVLSKDMMKRERDKIKKREQRANPMYRAKEKEKAKARMRMMRADPNYRERERRRDRIRRKISRQQNNELRQKEKDRDKEYKRLHRNLPLNSVMNEVEIGTNEDSMAGSSIGTRIGSGGAKTVLELHPEHFALRHSMLSDTGLGSTDSNSIDDGDRVGGHLSEIGGLVPQLNCVTLEGARAEAVLACPVTLQYTLNTDQRLLT
ncbi:uncharacterized protein LOC106876670 [Octopus bimaculoides]|uniref:Uncharacterized protein n=1 Tax=Octopus bimaculoides TaxID=37653 RepID=A0A0L8GI49_OCTBM|nr:uncharacterized protein LOC106876670 [Octopus bimaculoides]|eukprot:XP_014780789.1 PREDICTED: uncharacterized protein LOC106876670 [Octopus bimaculoides]